MRVFQLTSGPLAAMHVEVSRELDGRMPAEIITYTPGGGTITVQTTSEGGYVHVEVSDTGPGIAPDDLPHLFESLYRAESVRHLPGTGLGLTLLYPIHHTSNRLRPLHKMGGDTLFTMQAVSRTCET